MLKLNTPIQIYPDIFDTLAIVRIELDFRTRTIQAHLAPAIADANKINVGVLKNEKRIYPQIVATLTLTQNFQEPIQIIQNIFKDYLQASSRLEQLIIANKNEEGGLASGIFQSGLEEWSLDCTYVPTGDREIGELIRNNP